MCTRALYFALCLSLLTASAARAARTGSSSPVPVSTIGSLETDEGTLAERPDISDIVGTVGELESARLRYVDLIDRVSARHGVDARIVNAVVQVESGYRERATSPKGAMGLMQI